jgi:hypothetical protein
VIEASWEALVDSLEYGMQLVGEGRSERGTERRLTAPGR